ARTCAPISVATEAIAETTGPGSADADASYPLYPNAPGTHSSGNTTKSAPACARTSDTARSTREAAGSLSSTRSWIAATRITTARATTTPGLRGTVRRHARTVTLV